MVSDRAQTDQTLEARVDTAHRAYLEALIAWEDALRRFNYKQARTTDTADVELAIACDLAQAEKEKRRIVFRDLCDELGRLPETSGIGLPMERSCRSN